MYSRHQIYRMGLKRERIAALSAWISKGRKA